MLQSITQSSSAQRKPRLVSTHKPMGCVQAKPLMDSAPGGLERLKLENGYVANGFAAPRRSSTGQSQTDSARQHRHEARISNVEPGGSNERAGEDSLVLTGSEGDKDDDHVSHRASSVGEEELVDGWPKWLTDNISRDILVGLVPKSADSYDKLDKVGEGTYSNVYKARDRDTGKVVALKKVRFDTSEPESVKFMAREIMILRKLDHPNVVKLEGLATSRMQYSLYLVFEFMQSDLTRIITSPEGLTEPQVKCYIHQLLSGLQHCHDRGILHRDIKGSNLLIDRRGMLKIADFGLANYYVPPKLPLTNRVVTLWYRAPELLLGSTDYGVGIDLWSAGCVFAEMVTGRPLLPGRTEVEQLHRIFRLCGTPSEEYWKRLKLSTTFRPPRSYKPSLREAFKDFPSSSLGLLSTLLALDPVYRGTAALALQNEFFSTSPLACDISGLPVIYNEDDELKLAKEQRKSRNSKVRRSRTQRELRRRDISAAKLKELSAKQEHELEKTADSNAESEEPGSTTSSNSSSVNQAGMKESPIFSLSPVDGLPISASKNIKNLPPLPRSKARTAKYNKDGNMYSSNQVQRSASTREFRKFNQKEQLELYAVND